MNAEQIIINAANRNSIEHLFRQIRRKEALEREIEESRMAILASIWHLPDGSAVIGSNIREVV